MERYPKDCPLCESPRYTDEEHTDLILYECASGFMLEAIADVKDNAFNQSAGCAIIRHWKANHAEVLRKKRDISEKYGTLIAEYVRIKPVYEAAVKLGQWSEDRDPMQAEWGHLWHTLQELTAEASSER